MMKRDLCMAEIAKHHHGQILAAVYGAAFDLHRIHPSPLTFVSFGAMGLLSSQALGFAIALPNRRVVIIDGDGSLLMNLGTLVTIAEVAPRNLTYFVCENGTYEANGGHPIPGAGKIDLAAIATAAGFPRSYSYSELAEFSRDAQRLMQEDGPIFATLKVEPGELSAKDWNYIHGPESRAAFRRAIQEILEEA